jgi:hypothetical protein
VSHTPSTTVATLMGDIYTTSAHGAYLAATVTFRLKGDGRILRRIEDGRWRHETTLTSAITEGGLDRWMSRTYQNVRQTVV